MRSIEERSGKIRKSLILICKTRNSNIAVLELSSTPETDNEYAQIQARAYRLSARTKLRKNGIAFNKEFPGSNVKT